MGGKLLWASDEQGEIGKRPPLPADQFEISAESYLYAHERIEQQAKGKR